MFSFTSLTSKCRLKEQKMGRKIPGKKHRTIKDPAKQQQARFDSIKNKINNPPRNADNQEIPKSLLKLMALKNSVKIKNAKPQIAKKVKSGRKKRKEELMSVAKVLDKYPNTKSTGYIPNLVQKPDEAPHNFLKRLNQMTQKMIEEVEFEKKFGVQIRKDEETGEIIEVKKINSKKRTKKKKLFEKRKEKELKKRENSCNVRDFNQLKDTVKFGEVVERPPNLPAVKTKTKDIKKSNEAKYKNLLLMNSVPEVKSTQKPVKSKLEKEKAEIERKFIVDAYRKAKIKR